MKNKLMVFLLALSFTPLSFASKKVKKWKEVRPRVKVFTITFPASGVIGPKVKVDVNPTVAGRIEKVFIDEGKYVKKGTVLALMSSTDRAALIDAAKSEGKRSLRRWKRVYRPIPIIAPISGRVIKLGMVPGQTVGTTSLLLTLGDSLVVKADVDETDMAKVRVGQFANVRADAFPDKMFRAKVLKIAYQAQLKNSVNVYEVVLKPIRLPKRLRSGMGASIKFQEGKKKRRLVLPTWVTGGQENEKVSIYIKNKKGAAKRKLIKLGRNNGRDVEVLSNLSKKDIVLYQPLKLKKKKKNVLNL